jgi:heme-degrading monooxygenase HmoA
MFAVIFEVQPKKTRWDDYLALAKALKPKLEAMDGFIDNERFASRRTEGRLLSLSIWRDEKSVVRWRSHGEHHGVQEKGRFEVFEDYHLRVGEVIADNAPPQGMRTEATRLDATESGEATLVTITEGTEMSFGLDAAAPGLVDHEVFESIYNKGKLLLLASWRDTAAAECFTPPARLRHRAVRIIRDYGMFDRREAPQYYPHVQRLSDGALDTGLLGLA